MFDRVVQGLVRAETFEALCDESKRFGVPLRLLLRLAKARKSAAKIVSHEILTAIALNAQKQLDAPANQFRFMARELEALVAPNANDDER
jgi:hypothetical protein